MVFRMFSVFYFLFIRNIHQMNFRICLHGKTWGALCECMLSFRSFFFASLSLSLSAQQRRARPLTHATHSHSTNFVNKLKQR